LAWARLRMLSTASLVLTVAFRHPSDLSQLTLHDVCDLDANLARLFREACSPTLTELFHGILTSAELVDPRPSFATPLDRSGPMLAASPSARYNCHFIAPSGGWEPDGRTGEAKWVDSTGCSVLLPYTYQWLDDPSADA